MANLYANVHQLASAAELEACFAMVTSAPDQLLNRARTLAVGEEATCIALPARHGSQVIAEIIRPLWGLKRGRLSFKQGAAKIYAPE
jgi:cytosine deaminase